MIKYLALIFQLITTPLLAQYQLEINSIYTGENIFIQNPLADDLIHFCTDEIKVNDRIYITELNSSALKLDLQSLKIPLGEKVTITLTHKEGCKPKVLQPMAHPPRISKIRFDSIKLDQDGLLTWTCFNDSIGARPVLRIEQFRFNRWIDCSQVEQGWNYKNQYSTTVNMYPGKNVLRIHGSSSISDTLFLYSKTKPVDYNLSVANKIITFSDSVSFELQTEKGTRYIHGKGQTINLADLTDGNYILYFDNEMLKFSIRRKKMLWARHY